MKRAAAGAILLLGMAALAIFVVRRDARQSGGSPDPGSPAPAPTATEPAVAVPRVKALDLDGRVHAIGGVSTTATALVFLGIECPIANSYIPALSALARDRAARGVALYGVISDPTTTRAAAVEHARAYAVGFPILFDATGELAALLRPLATPEAFVLAADGHLAYRGRIDDGYEAPGKQRQVVGHRELADALEAVEAGKPVAVPRTTPVGCVFEAWGKSEGLPATITYTRDVAPLLAVHCAQCHHEGGIAPFALTSFAQASKRARMIADLTASRAMPPWRAAPDFGHFLDERRLTDREIATFAAWAKAGAPEGDAPDLPPMPTFGSSWQLGEPDLVVTMPQPFEVPASGPDIYRAFVIRAQVPEDKTVVAVEFRPGAPSVVHHCLIHLDASGMARKLEERAGGNGFHSFGGLGFPPTGSLGGWVPGATPRFLPHDLGRLFPRHSDIVLQIHYHPSGKVEHDRSSLAIYYARKPVKKIVAALSVWSRDIDIPPGASSYKRVVDQALPADVTLVGIAPHMHLVGRSMKVTATRPSGEVVPLVWIPSWDFRWQDQYLYETPIELPKGTKIRIEAIYDNSADNPSNPSSPPRRVTFGEQTTDEMCLCFLAIAVDKPPPRK